MNTHSSRIKPSSAILPFGHFTLRGTAMFFRLLLMFSMVLPGACSAFAGERKTPSEETRAASAEESEEIELKKGVAWLNDNGSLHITYRKGQTGVLLPIEYLVFDREKRVSGVFGGGFTMRTKESPVATVLHLGPGGRGWACGKYGGIEIDVTELQEKERDIRVIEQTTPKREHLCSVALVVHGHKTIRISDDYIVSADSHVRTDDAGPYVSIRFGVSEDTANSLQRLSATTVVLVRNGKEVVQAPFAEFQKTGVVVASVKKSDDVLQWRIIAENGEAIRSGTLGFPMSGVTKNLVHYIIELDKLPENAKSQETRKTTHVSR